MQFLKSYGIATWMASIVLQTLIPCPLAAEPSKNDQVLIYSPRHFNELNDAEFFAHGGAALRKQFLDTGFAATNITLLTDESATADRLRQELGRLTRAVGPNDLLFVAVASHGVHLRGIDYVCGTDTSVAELRKLYDERNRLPGATTVISLQEIIEQMSLSASSKRFLLVDTAVSRDPLPRTSKGTRNLADRFGNQPVQVADKLWVTCSRSGRLDNKGAMTCFMRSVVDGLTGHADDNRDGHVSVFEISDYVQAFAKATGYTPPILHARAKEDYVVAAATETRKSLSGLPSELQEQLGRALLDVGKTSLLLDGDTKTAINALEQAAQFATSPKVKKEAEGLLLTAMASNGDIATAWQQAQARNLPLLVATQIPTRVYQAPHPIGYYYRWNDTLDPKVLLQVSELKDDEWFGFGKSYRTTADGGLHPGPAEQGWIRSPEFPLETGAANRL